MAPVEHAPPGIAEQTDRPGDFSTPRVTQDQILFHHEGQGHPLEDEMHSSPSSLADQIRQAPIHTPTMTDE
jgi:hypothetical protein